jgi:hypothetical protein
MDILELNQIYDKKISSKELISFIKKNLSGFNLKTHYSYIGYCQSSIDVMQDHLNMAFIWEKLSQYSDITKYERNYDSSPPEILATLIPYQNSIIQLAEELRYVSILKTDDSDPNEEDWEDIVMTIDDFQENIEQISFKFPNEIEDYYANYINQGLYEIASEYSDHEEESDDEEEYLSSCFNKNPEWKYGFWKNHLPNTPKESVYCSSFCWIVKNDIDVNSVLSKHSGIEYFVFDDADLIRNLIINNFTAIDFNSLENFDLTLSFIDKLTGSSSSNFKFQVSQNTDIVKVSYSEYYIVYFSFQALRENALRKLYEKTSLLKEKLSILLDISKDIYYDWNIFTDESFEELCHNIIYNDIRFDNQTIRKMGKSKSRDGGRDIVVWTKPLSGNLAKKYIIQCKLLQKSLTLSKSMMNNVSNVIMEYDADGYIIMTNAVIDSGLYDMLDGFNKNPKMNTDTKINYSKFELERYLDSHKDIKQKYFKNV